MSPDDEEYRKAEEQLREAFGQKADDFLRNEARLARRNLAIAALILIAALIAGLYFIAQCAHR
jgi:hypothetical protein